MFHVVVVIQYLYFYISQFLLSWGLGTFTYSYPLMVSVAQTRKSTDLGLVSIACMIDEENDVTIGGPQYYSIIAR